MMQRTSRTLLILAVLVVLGKTPAFSENALSEGSRSDDGQPSVVSQPPASPEMIHKSVDRALEFLTLDAAKWRQERGCATCHHGVMTVWALSEARRQGYAVPAEPLADTVKWTKDLLVPQFSKPRDPRWGYNFVSLPGIYLGIMSQTLPILSRDEGNRVAVHLANHQEEDGAWLVPPQNANTSPPTWESRETIALWALLAWEPYVPADPQAAAAARAAREKVVTWLANSRPAEITQELSLRLLLDIREGRTADQIQPKIDELLARQNPDGGWSQFKELPSDAYATGQLLWILSFSGIPPDDPQIRRAISYLVANQQENGSWPMTPRAISGPNASKKRNPVPITYLGAAWATLGIVRFVPPNLDIGTRQKLAFDFIRSFGGSYETDPNGTEKPVVAIKIGVEIDDDQLGTLAKLLPAFPQLKSLQLKSPMITDIGAAHLKRVFQLRNLSLEQAAITDAGLMRLNALTGLEVLNLKETKITDAGVADFQRASPTVKVQR